MCLCGKKNYFCFMAESHNFGKQGEDEAEKLLKSKGFDVLGRNLRFAGHEVDIVAQKGKLLIVAEVKTRSYATLGEPEEFVSKKQQQNMVKAANAFVIFKKLDVDVRFDIISIVKNQYQNKITHIEDAFYPVM
jgi:putative endonuclease